MRKIKISVCMATFNGEKFLAEQLSSILGQLNELDEVIIIDDNSTDSTLSIISSLNDDRIKVYQNSRNRGVIYSFGLALEKARGEYIFLSDQDDIWLPEKVNSLLALFDTNSVDMILHDAYIMNNNEIQLDTFFEIRKTSLGIYSNLYKNSFIGCCMAFRRRLLEKALPFPEKISMHDIWLGLIASYYGSVELLDKPLILYRRHSENVTSMQHGSINKMIISRFNNSCALLCRVIKE